MAPEMELKVIEIVSDKLGVEESEVLLSALFIDDLGADSLDMVEIIMEVEETTGVQFTDEDGERIAHGTVSGLLEFIDQRLPQEPQAA